LRFETTNWSLILQARGAQATPAREALASLCASYWPPVYAFIRRRGRAPADAEDLTQAYFARFFEKGYVNAFRPEVGRFRAFLLASVTHFWPAGGPRAGQARRRRATCRSTPERGGAAAARAGRPPHAGRFERQWTAAVLAFSA
jgi:RNA polymerase sigma-70 factor (ECF subfamily)